MKIAGKILRKSLKETDFGLDDDFCDAEGLKKSWEETQIPNDWITFYSSLFNLKRLAVVKEKSKSKSSRLDEVYDDDNDDDSDEDKMMIVMKIMMMIVKMKMDLKRKM